MGYVKIGRLQNFNRKASQRGFHYGVHQNWIYTIMNSKLEDLQLQVINYLRFPLIVAVVFIHSNPSDVVFNGQSAGINYNLSVYEEIRYFISEIVARIAVPSFFFISGFLFFRKMDYFNIGIYVQKLKKRGRSLLIPYLFWNLVVVLFFYLAQTFLKGLLSGNNLLIVDYTWQNWIQAFWNGNAGENMPINYPLWFIRDLMVVVVFSPIVYWGIKRLQSFFALLLGTLWLFNLWIDITGFSIVAFFFFSLGAYWGINKMNFIETFNRLFPYSLWGYIILSVCNLLYKEYDWCSYVHKASILVGLSMFISLTSHCLKKQIWKTNTNLAHSSFFIYAYHGMPLALMIKLLVKVLYPQTNIDFIIIYIICPFITIVLGLCIYKILTKYFPKFTALMIGGR